MAGESARAEASTPRDDAQQLLKGDVPGEDAASDEESTARVLASLPHHEWRIFHDVRWPERRHANIDHVVVGPGGVFVIESKNWTGSIDVRSGALRQDGKRRSRTVIASAAAAIAVSELLPDVDIKAVKPVLCFMRGEPVFGWSGDVMICSTENVAMFLTSGPRLFDEARVLDIAVALSVSLDVAPSAPRAPTPSGLVAVSAQRKRGRTRPARLPRAPMPRSAKIVLRLALLVGVLALAVQLHVPGRIGHLGAQVTQTVIAPTKPIGTPVSVPAMGSRPSLEVTASTPVVTRSSLSAVRPQQGHQLIAVPLRIENTGDAVWNSDSDVRAEITDQTGVSYSADPAFSSVAAGSGLPAKVRLRAGRTTRGLIVFEVPAGTQAEKVRITVGPGLPKTLRWSVD